MRGFKMVSCAVSLTFAVLGSAQEVRNPKVESLLRSVDAARIHATVARLVSFGTRHTLSETASESRGIGAARRYLASEFGALAKLPGSRLQPFEDRFTADPGPRIPKAVELVNVGAVLPGTDASRTKEAIVLTGHYDTRASGALDASSDAPGAVDDGSGTALALELARAMAAERPAVGIYFIAVAGEEQGLVGSTHLARRLKAEGIRVLAMVSVDVAGNTEGQDGVKDNVHGRLWSEGVSVSESPEERRLRQSLGTENDGAAREWARYVERAAERYVENLDLLVMLRRDRIARGSDHMSFAAEGFPAICLREMHEHYDRQHQDVRTIEGRSYGDDLAHLDAAYTAKLAKGLGAALWQLSHAPQAPVNLTLGGAVSPDARLRWTLPDEARTTAIHLFRRRADGVAWQRIQRFPKANSLVLKDVPPDNEVFAVAAVDADGNESLPVYPSKLE
ncbi:MAG: M20/M25/M40 family metallo-hydrolase [Holophagaceae bacterium]|nr:M20/M25/M40 family metallo-hydrolase [Holophagaceae bacterium]